MKRIIILDDDEDIRDVLTIAFRSKYIVEAFANPRELLDQPYQPPGLFIIDIQMPYMDGLTLCRDLKNNSIMQHIPVFIMSAQQHFEKEALQSGASAVFPKPFDLKKLMLAADQVLL